MDPPFEGGFGAMSLDAMTKPTEIETPRLRLVALTPELAQMQVEKPIDFFEALGVAPEPSWPPEFMDHAAMKWAADQLAAHPSDTGWYAWVYVSPVLNRLLGAGGFRGRSQSSGEVEIEYSMLLSYREQGLATEGVRALMDWAYGDPSVQRIVARTPLDRNASHRVLEKSGFTQSKQETDPDTGIDMIYWSHERLEQAA